MLDIELEKGEVYVLPRGNGKWVFEFDRLDRPFIYDSGSVFIENDEVTCYCEGSDSSPLINREEDYEYQGATDSEIKILEGAC